MREAEKKTPTFRWGFERELQEDFFLGYAKSATSFFGLTRWAVAWAAAAFHMDRWMNSYARTVDGTAGDAGKQGGGDQSKQQFQFHGLVSVVVVVAVMMVVAVMVIHTHINVNRWPDANLGAGYGTGRE